MREVFFFGAFAVAAVAVLMHCVGCLSAAQKEAVADGMYLEEHMRCVDTYDTRREIDACRQAVRIRWGISETGKDAGHDR